MRMGQVIERPQGSARGLADKDEPELRPARRNYRFYTRVGYSRDGGKTPPMRIDMMKARQQSESLGGDLHHKQMQLGNC
jgi:hypothetical protein